MNDFTDEEWDEISAACLRIAHAFGFGPSWRAPTIEGPAYVAEDGSDEGVTSFALAVAHPGRIVESAARSIRGSTATPLQREWSKHRGIVALPVSTPDVFVLIAATEASLLLLYFALQHAEGLQAALTDARCADASHLGITAARDALARVMFTKQVFLKHPECTIKQRAKALRIREETFRTLTRRFERRIRSRLLASARRFNRINDVAIPVSHGMQRHKLRTQTFWHPKRAANKAGPVRLFAGDMAAYRLRSLPSQRSLFAKPISVEIGPVRIFERIGRAQLPADYIHRRGISVLVERPTDIRFRPIPLRAVSGDFYA